MGRPKKTLVFAILLLTYSTCFGAAYSGSGAGTEVSPYIINTYAQLLEFGQPGYGCDANLTSYWKLGADVNALASSTLDGGTGWRPVGTSATPFTGGFDGDCCTIDHITIARGTTDYVGFFGKITGDDIKNLGLLNVVIHGKDYTGGLVGYDALGASNTISKCWTTGSVSGEVRTGGLVGYEYVAAIITNCYSQCSVTGTNRIGGFAGMQFTTINCYSTGAVTGDSNLGGFSGVKSVGNISNCFWDTQTSGQATSAGGTGKTTANMKKQATFVSWDFTNLWGIVENSTYPYFITAATVCTVPNIVDTVQADANAAILGAGFVIGTITTAYRTVENDIVDGNIMSQDPSTGVKTCGSDVNYVVSLGGPAVPDIVGETKTDANAIIAADANFYLGDITTAYSNSVASGVVISQDPAAGTTTGYSGDQIDYVASLGKPAVPDIVNHSKTDANSHITGVDSLVVGTITVACCNNVTSGLVISSNPVATTLVDIGSAVDYVVSTGRPTVPDVVNQTEANAIILINAVSYISYGTHTHAYSGSIVSGNVISQSSVGVQNCGTVVNLVISTGTTYRYLTASSGANGTVTTPGIGTYPYNDGSSAYIVATPGEARHFTIWTGTAATAGKITNVYDYNTYVLMDADYTVIANFYTNPGTLIIAAGTTDCACVGSCNGGVVTTPGLGLFGYITGASATLLAVPSAHYHFVNWTDADVGPNLGLPSLDVNDANAASTNITMDANYSLLANFTVDTNSLVISAAGGGTITTPSGGEGTYSYKYSCDANIIALAGTNSTFSNWTGTAVTAGKVDDVNAIHTHVLMDNNYTVIANFDVNDPNIPIAHWPLDDNADTNVVVDIQGYANGILHGTNDYTSAHHVAGKVGTGAFDFNGVTDYVDVSNTITALANLTKGTISLWVNPIILVAGLDQSYVVITDNNNLTFLRMYFYRDEETPTYVILMMNFYVDNGEKWNFIGDALPSSFFNVWNHFVLVHNGTRPYLYINGQEESHDWFFSVDSTKWFKALFTDATAKANIVSLGGTPSLASVFFSGSLDDVIIYAKALSAAEVWDLYCDGCPECAGCLKKNHGWLGEWLGK
jgi:beta-lactam-binding protein with PASTA domain